jgi:hypothetical protein
MTTAIAALIFLGIPLALLVFMKANAGIMFLTACAGIVLLGTLDTTFVATAGAVVPGEGEATVRLFVVMFSLIISGVAFRGSVRGARLISNGLVVILLAAMLWLQLPPIVGASWLVDTMQESAWQTTKAFQTLIIASGLAVSLLVIMTKDHKPKKSRH